MNKIIISMGMICLLLPGIIKAQDKAGTQSLKPKPAATAVATVPEKAELELQKVIPIFKAIAWDQFKKSTFETVAQYHARIAKLEFPREKILFELDLNDVK